MRGPAEFSLCICIQSKLEFSPSPWQLTTHLGRVRGAEQEHDLEMVGFNLQNLTLKSIGVFSFSPRIPH